MVRALYAALDDGDRAVANRLIHSEDGDTEVTEQAADAMEDTSLTVENVRLVEERADSATVEATVTVSPLDSERERTDRLRIELRPKDGRWRIYASG